jgi:hypothetical protein
MVTTDCSRRTPVWVEHNLFGVAQFHDADDAVRTNLKQPTLILPVPQRDLPPAIRPPVPLARAPRAS